MNRRLQSPQPLLPSPRVTRREAIQLGAVSVIGGTAAAVAPICGAESASKSQLRLGAIGVGNRGLDNIASVATERIVALCDVDERYLQTASERYPDAKTYRDFRKMLDRDDLDGVIVSSTDHTHFHASMMALRRGLHVYCEKPLAHTITETRSLAAEAKQNRLTTQLGNQHHSSAGYRSFVDWTRSGNLGKPVAAHVWTNRPLWEQGIPRPTGAKPPDHLDWDLWLGPAPERPYHSTYHPIGWRAWWDFGGGALCDMGPHLLDPIFWSLRLPPPTRIRAQSAEATDECAPVWSIIEFEFAVPTASDSKQTATSTTFKLTWYDGIKQPPYEVTGAKRPPANGALLLTERARLFAPELGGDPIVVPIAKGERFVAPNAVTTGSNDHHQEWVNACKGNGATSCPFDEVTPLLETCLLGNVAIRAGAEIEWYAETGTVRGRPDLQRLIDGYSYRPGWTL